jgi:hypothetical protein
MIKKPSWGRNKDVTTIIDQPAFPFLIRSTNSGADFHIRESRKQVSSFSGNL